MDLEHEKRLTAVEGRAASNTHRLDDLEKRQDNLDDLVSTVKVLAIQEKQLETDVKEMKGDIKSLVNKPAQKWDAMTDRIIWAVVAAALGFILAQFGLQ